MRRAAQGSSGAARKSAPAAEGDAQIANKTREYYGMFVKGLVEPDG